MRDTLVLLGVALAAGAAAFLVSFDGTPAYAQGKAAAGGIIAVPVQSGTGAEALCIIDTGKQMICVYEVTLRSKKALVLSAARKYEFDMQVPEYQTWPSLVDIEKQAEKIRKKMEDRLEKEARKKK